MWEINMELSRFQSHDLEKLGAGRGNSITTNQRTNVNWENLY